jgi:hypothetical protein
MTLAELLVSGMAASILMTGMASAILLASKALPENSTELNGTVEATDVAAQWSSELQCALTVTENSKQAITFTVPDRDNDGNPETIRYAWGGNAGDPLSRTYNGGSAVKVLYDVQSLAFSYAYREETEEVEADPIESGETVLALYSNTSGTSDVWVGPGYAYGEYFAPALPGDTISWSITNVWIRLRKGVTDDGVVRVELRPARASKRPRDEVLASQTLLESSLAGVFSWRAFDFSSVAGLAPGDALCIVIVHESGTSVNLEYHGSTTAQSGQAMLAYAGSWGTYPNDSLLFYVYGKYVSPGGTTENTIQFVTNVRMGMRIGEDDKDVSETLVQLLNTPEVIP